MSGAPGPFLLLQTDVPSLSPFFHFFQMQEKPVQLVVSGSIYAIPVDPSFPSFTPAKQLQNKVRLWIWSPGVQVWTLWVQCSAPSSPLPAPFTYSTRSYKEAGLCHALIFHFLLHGCGTNKAADTPKEGAGKGGRSVSIIPSVEASSQACDKNPHSRTELHSVHSAQWSTSPYFRVPDPHVVAEEPGVCRMARISSATWGCSPMKGATLTVICQWLSWGDSWFFSFSVTFGKGSRPQWVHRISEIWSFWPLGRQSLLFKRWSYCPVFLCLSSTSRTMLMQFCIFNS